MRIAFYPEQERERIPRGRIECPGKKKRAAAVVVIGKRKTQNVFTGNFFVRIHMGDAHAAVSIMRHSLQERSVKKIEHGCGNQLALEILSRTNRGHLPF